MAIIEGKEGYSACLCDLYERDGSGFVSPASTGPYDVLYLDLPYPNESHMCQNQVQTLPSGQVNAYPMLTTKTSISATLKMKPIVTSGPMELRNALRRKISEWEYSFPYFIMWNKEKTLNEWWWGEVITDSNDYYYTGEKWCVTKPFMRVDISGTKVQSTGGTVTLSLQMQRALNE